MSNKEKETDEVEDVIRAKDIALDYLSKQGIIVFLYEIMSIFKRSSAWFVTIEGKTFTGIVLINSKTGEVVTKIKL